MKTMTLLTMICALGAPIANAGEEKADEQREALREEMAEVRRELADAAQRMAELSRELGAEAGSDFAFRFFAPDAARTAMLGIAIGESDEKGGGIEVQSVTPGGPADKAGIQAGDIVLAIGETDLTKAESPAEALINAIRDHKPGEVVEVSYRRGNDERSAKVTLDVFSSRGHFFGGPHAPGIPPRLRPPAFLELMHGWGDIELAPLSRELGEYFGTDEGLLVVRAPDDEGFKLQDGDVILAIGGRKPEDPAHAMRILRSYRGGEKLVLDIVRKREKMSLEVLVPERRTSMTRLPRRKVVTEGSAPE